MNYRNQKASRCFAKNAKRAKRACFIAQFIGEKIRKRQFCEVCAKSEDSFDCDFDATEFYEQHIKATMAKALSGILAADPRCLLPDAYEFVLESCRKAWTNQTNEGPYSTHYSGQQVRWKSFANTALEQFGTKAKSVLNRWGVFRCEDFGEIVFNLVNAHLLLARPHDSRDDFRRGYDFDEAFPEART